MGSKMHGMNTRMVSQGKLLTSVWKLQEYLGVILSLLSFITKQAIGNDLFHPFSHPVHPKLEFFCSSLRSWVRPWWISWRHQNRTSVLGWKLGCKLWLGIILQGEGGRLVSDDKMGWWSTCMPKSCYTALLRIRNVWDEKSVVITIFPLKDASYDPYSWMKTAEWVPGCVLWSTSFLCKFVRMNFVIHSVIPSFQDEYWSPIAHRCTLW